MELVVWSDGECLSVRKPVSPAGIFPRIEVAVIAGIHTPVLLPTQPIVSTTNVAYDIQSSVSNTIAESPIVLAAAAHLP